jgi:ABC-type branched-subunit amino acid transport system permease subunit
MPGAARALRVVVVLAGAVAVPLVLDGAQVLRVLILAGLFVVLAISYDLVVGQTGALSLAHPAFYAIGAYTVAILIAKHGVGALPAFAAAAFLSALAAVVIGIPSFRLSEHSFAIGTLGFAWVLQLVTNNWIDLTEGPMCITAVPPLRVALPGGVVFSTVSLQSTYYGMLALAALTYALAVTINGSRVGRACHAVRENQVAAEMHGVHSLFYKLLMFAVGAAVAGVAGGYFATYSSIVCPTEAMQWTVILLIVVYLGGVGSVRGVTIGAVLFTILPELLRVTKEARLVIYGVLLLLFALYLPEGIDGFLRRLGHVAGRRRAPPTTEET